MPRKIDPKVGQDGYEKEWVKLLLEDSPFKTPLDLLEDIQPQFCRTRFQSKLVIVGNCYRRWKGRGASAFTRAEAVKALEPMAAGEPSNMWAIHGLNERAQSELYNFLIVLNKSDLVNGEPLVTVLMDGRVPAELLASGAQAAIKNLRSHSGPDPDGELYWVVENICSFYEHFTKRPVKLSNKGERLGYKQEPQSAAGHFVLACMKEIDSTIPKKIPPSRISQAMRSYITQH